MTLWGDEGTPKTGQGYLHPPGWLRCGRHAYRDHAGGLSCYSYFYHNVFCTYSVAAPPRLICRQPPLPPSSVHLSLSVEAISFWSFLFSSVKTIRLWPLSVFHLQVCFEIRLLLKNHMFAYIHVLTILNAYFSNLLKKDSFSNRFFPFFAKNTFLLLCFYCFTFNVFDK